MFGLGRHPCWSRRRPRTAPRSCCRGCRSGWWSSPSSDSGRKISSWWHTPLKVKHIQIKWCENLSKLLNKEEIVSSLTWLSVRHVRRVPHSHKSKLVESPVTLVGHLHRPSLPSIHDLIPRVPIWNTPTCTRDFWDQHLNVKSLSSDVTFTNCGKIWK